MDTKREMIGNAVMFALGLALLSAAGPAEAGGRTRIGHSAKSQHRVGVGHARHDGYALQIGHSVKRRAWTTGHARRIWVEPVYTIRQRVIEVPALYETRERQVWHEPVYEYRRVALRHRRSGFQVDISLGGRRAWRTEKVLTREGYWETVYEEVLVRRATTRIVEERVLVRAGYWRSMYDGRAIPVRRGHDRSFRGQHGFTDSHHGGGRRPYRR